MRKRQLTPAITWVTAMSEPVATMLLRDAMAGATSYAAKDIGQGSVRASCCPS
jgi:hypothetical protein